MYESTRLPTLGGLGALGWSSLSPGRSPFFGSCAGFSDDRSGNPVCFTDSPGDRMAAADPANRCVQLTRPVFGGNFSCTTEEGNGGTVHCCGAGLPRPYPTTSSAILYEQERRENLEDEGLVMPLPAGKTPTPSNGDGNGQPTVGLAQILGPIAAVALLAGAGYMAYVTLTR